MASWLNHVAIAAPRNGTTTHTVSPSSGTVAAGTAFTPTAGRLLVCVVEGAVTSTLPSGWTLGASAVNNTGLYVWYRTAAGADSLTTTHNGSDYPAVFDFYEFGPASTWAGAIGSTAVANSAAGPTLTGLTGTNWIAGAVGLGWSASPAGTPTVTWGSGVEAVDLGTPFNVHDGYLYSLTYLEDSVLTSASSAATVFTGGAGLSPNQERLQFAVKVVNAVIPTVVGTPTTAIQASGTTITLSKPAGLANGDYLIAFLRSQQAASPTDWTATGFTRAPGPAFVANNSNIRVQGIYYKLVTDATTEPSTYVFTVGGTANRAVGLLAVVRGIDTASPFLGPGSTYGGDGISNGRRVPAYTIPIPALVMLIAAGEFVSPNDHVPTVPPAGYTQLGMVTTSAVLTTSRTAAWVGAVNDLDGTAALADTVWSVLPGAVGAVGVAARGLAVTAATGRPKVWNGTAWVQKPAKVWTGSTWVEKPVKVWTGSTWKTVG